jgi:2-polyprenyl-3-methyl-5-hydroxy-6-metoxy-1,4-benzoquinol methylase
MMKDDLAQESNKLSEIRTAAAEEWDAGPARKPFGPEWTWSYWGKWQTIVYMLQTLGIKEGASILDVGAGDGWTTVFLAEAGYKPLGVDLAPAHVAVAQRRAERVRVDARFAVADMDALDLAEQFDAILVFDALHHTARQAQVVERLAKHLKPGGWVVFGEPSWLHRVSPGARRVSRETGWIERGITVRGLKRDCKAAGLSQFQRFYEGTAPHQGVASLGWELLRLVATHLTQAPQMSVWLAASRYPLRPASEVGDRKIGVEGGGVAD